MVSFLYMVTLLSSLIGLFVFVGANSAPQEAAAAAGGLAFAVIPYVFTRCVQLSNEYSRSKRHQERVVDLLEALGRRNQER
jgi:hypothetical protein